MRRVIRILRSECPGLGFKMMIIMKQLTQKGEEIMERMWDHGPMLVRELQSFYDDPKPPIRLNTKD